MTRRMYEAARYQQDVLPRGFERHAPNNHNRRPIDIRTLSFITSSIMKRLTGEAVEQRVLLSGSPYLVEDLLQVAASSSPQDLTEFQDQVFFSAQTNELGRELWKTDGNRRWDRLDQRHLARRRGFASARPPPVRRGTPLPSDE